MSIENHAPTWISLDGAANARVVVPGVLLRADNLQSLSGKDVRVLIDQEGLEVVVDLRTDVEVHLEEPGPLTAEGVVRIEHRSLYPDSGQRIDAIMARLVSSPTYREELEGHDPQRHAPLPGTMEGVPELVGLRFGGSAAWLSANRLSDLDLERLRRRLAPPEQAESCAN